MFSSAASLNATQNEMNIILRFWQCTFTQKQRNLLSGLSGNSHNCKQLEQMSTVNTQEPVSYNLREADKNFLGFCSFIVNKHFSPNTGDLNQNSNYLKLVKCKNDPTTT